MPANNLPLVSIVIPTHNRKEKVIRLIKSVLASAYPLSKMEIIVVDDASIDGTYEEILKAFSASNVKIIECPVEKLVAECRNIGLDSSKGEYAFFVDDDVVVDRNAIFELIKFMERNKDVGVAGPLIMYQNMPNVIWSAGIAENLWTTLGKFIGQNEMEGKFKDPIICDAIPTAFVVRRSIAANVRFSSKLFPIQFEEIDFCIRVNRSGYKIVVVPWAKAWHERPTASFLRNPLRTYFDVRNRFIRQRLWSTSYAQYLTSGIFALLIPLSYVILSIKFTPNYVRTLKCVFKGVKDGLRLSLTLDRPAIYRRELRNTVSHDNYRR
jgi:GT2 family glycosyltransferase